MHIEPGQPYPLGATECSGKLNFALFAPYAEKVQLCLLNVPERQILLTIELHPEIHRTGAIWHAAIRPPSGAFYYAFRLKPMPENADEDLLLLDPYAKSVSCDEPPIAQISLPNKSFDWQGVCSPKLTQEELIIYEMHVKGFTADHSSQVRYPGTFKGVIEKIPHLIDLGINAVELMPVQRFKKYDFINPPLNEKVTNYWGYSTVNYFALENSYSCQPQQPDEIINEFKEMVRELHRNKIEVILDIVLNHTAEGNERGVVQGLKAFANDVYYLLNWHKEYYNFSGCGNTLNCNHPVVIEMIIAILRYWVVEMHIDGFRFDLATIFYRSEHGEVLSSAPVLEAISKDPILSQTKLIAEPWDMHMYSVGHFYAATKRWSEWNANYRDSVRRFIKGTGEKGKFASCLCGSENLYWQRSPAASINFLTAHDGFTLADLVSYNFKHNEANQENNRDGHNFNDSWNCGLEGPTAEIEILALRKRQMRNFHLALMLSQGIPMLLMGDEYGHTKHGNNNSWNQNNALNWMLWHELEKNQAFYRFYKLIIHFRKKYVCFRRKNFLTSHDIEWYDHQLNLLDWHQHLNFVAFILKDEKIRFYVAFNATNQNITVTLPLAAVDKRWQWIANTANASPNDFYDEPQEVHVQEYKMLSFSAILLQENVS